MITAATLTSSPELLARIDGLQRRCLIAGASGLGLSAVGYFVSPEQFFRSYLVAFVLWNGVALGSLAVLMLHHLSGGQWGVVIRRMLEAASRTFPVTLALFIPIAFGLQHLYSWSRPDVIAKDELLRHKLAYLNVPFFLGRAAFYFAIWIALAHILSKWSLEQDRTGAEPAHTRMQVLSGPGLLLYGFTVTFSSIDWIMSLDPHWFSTIFGILFMGGQGVSALAFVILVIVLLIDYHPVSTAIFPRHLHDYGKLLFAFVMLWAYFSFSQFLIVWSANLPEEIPFYLKRMTGGWKWIGLALILLHFVLPFLLLLSQNTKKNYRTLWRIAALVFFMRFVDLFWIAAPNFQPAATMSIHWLDIAAPVGVGGIWLAAFFRQLRQRPLLPAYEPELEEALEHEHH